MKNIFRISGLILLILSIFLIHSCKKDEPKIPTTLTDIDGNTYNVIAIGTQVWIAENLKVTHYHNGDPIPNVIDDPAWYNSNFSAWGNLTIGAYCDYDNTPSNSITYGKLYNWYAVNDSRNIAPIGWHVATDAEWTTLTTYLGGEGVDGGKLKETANTHWNSPNEGATNESGFTALPGGSRSSGGPFDGIGYYGLWWSSSDTNTVDAWYRSLTYASSFVGRFNIVKQWGFSVRCIMDY